VATWSEVSGEYGTLRVDVDGAISGTLAGCIAQGAPQGSIRAASLLVANLTLTSCAVSGRYSAVIDLPANDNDAPALVIGGASNGWRVER